MLPQLLLVSISSTQVDLETWNPKGNEDVFLCLDLEIGMTDAPDSTNMFYVTLATEEAIQSRGELLPDDSKRLLVHEYDYQSVLDQIHRILQTCNRPTWDESCRALCEYFQWEYQDYVAE